MNPTLTAEPAGPVTASERVAVLDALRGIALFGVCVANLIAVLSLYGVPGAPDPATLPTAATDPAAEFLMHVLVEGKFYSLFSLLFGIGFAVQLQRAEARGEGVSRYVRRLLVLFGIGLAHILLVWPGDILALYALVGLLLVLLRRLSDRALLVTAAVLLLVPVADYAAYWLTDGAWAPAEPFFDAAQRMGRARLRPLLPGQGGAIAAALSEDWQVLFVRNQVGLIRRMGSLIEQVRPAKVLAMFLIGLWVGRRSLFRDLDAAAPLLRRVALVGLGVGLPLNVLLAWLMEQDVLYGPRPDFAASPLGLVQTLAYALGVAPLALGFAASFALAWRAPRGRRAGGLLAPAGRMALTNYLTQTVIAIALFYGVGLGLAGTVGPTLLWPLAAVIIAVQATTSAVWLRRFRFGPVEWLWRSLTYGRAQPMRLAPPAPATRAS